MTLDQLTAPELDSAAWDLRNAALVVEHCGHAKTTLLNSQTGGVCAAGAIDLATKAKLGYAEHPYKLFLYLYHPIDAEVYRAENAYAAFAASLPAGLCDRCDYGAPCDCCPTRRPPHEDCLMRAENAWERVTHYNDVHCPGGTTLAGMLRLSADRAQLVASERRSILADRLLEPV